MVNFMIAVGVILTIIQINRLMAVMMIILIWPFIGAYVAYIESIRNRIVVNET